MAKRIKAEVSEDGQVDATTTELEEDEEVELEDATDEVSSPVASTGIEVTYQERSITRTFGKQKITSGGRLNRYFTPESHGKNYKKIADQFIQTLKIQDENSSERPKYVSHREI